MSSPSPKFLIVGAGIIGLTIAKELRKQYPSSSITLLEKESKVGMHASGKNSGVLHSGIYYGSDTLKAKVCADGAGRMIAYAHMKNIPVRQGGKIIIPTKASELPVLEKLLAQARSNGINAELLSAEEIKEVEPAAKPYKQGIHCPSVAVIDSKRVLASLEADLAASGVELRFDKKVENVLPGERRLSAGDEIFHYDYLINCAGAYADQIARYFDLAQDAELIPFKGFYYKLNPAKAQLIHSNIYPVPNPAMPFLGVHFTRVIDDQVYMGPTAVPVLGRENYRGFQGINGSESAAILKRICAMYFTKDASFRNLVHREMWNYLKPYFVAQAKKMVDGIELGDFMACDKAGIRPQLVNTETQKLIMDFKVEQTANSLHILNAISPAFTSSFALAEYLVKEKVSI